MCGLLLNWLLANIAYEPLCMHEKALTQTAVAVVNHKVGSEGPGREVVHAAGTVRHVAHHNGVGLREPAQKTVISAVMHTTQGEVHVSS